MSSRLVIHAPSLETEDIGPDSLTGRVRGAKIAPAVRVNGRPVNDHPDRGAQTRMEVPLKPGRHRVEVMVKQTYETVLVELARDETVALRIGYLRQQTDGNDRLYVGSKTYVNRASNAGSSAVLQGVGCGAALWFLAYAALTLVVMLTGKALGLTASQAVLGSLAGAVVVGIIGGILVFWKVRRQVTDTGEVATKPIRMDGGALLLPAAVEPPSGRSGIVLRVRARPRTLNMIGFSARLLDTKKRTWYEFYYNELIDWAARPRVFLDGRELGAAWGKWWIPAGAGTHRLRVEINGIGGCKDVAAAGEADIVVGAGAEQVEARFNFIAMAHRREEARPELVSRWQRVMRRAKRYEDMAGQALGEPDLEFVTHEPK
ncbi:hypothetical protein [Glycomyces sp. NRRL B-16210]|uniref:hypothetical protein n=1 Tax=Glycomyces sp. NRRL B-16210 TaxID=1463821 RepID=UPI0004C038E5|nr:hypothetical protein [Glycomyces sp. NRRL B-16210]